MKAILQQNRSIKLALPVMVILAILILLAIFAFPSQAVELVSPNGSETAINPFWQSFLQSYLVAYMFWLGIALGCLALSMIHQLVHGTWGLATSRLFEAGAGTLPCMALLFVPILLGVSYLYPWALADSEVTEHFSASKSAYLSVTGFTIRALLYLCAWVVLALLLNRWSRQRDGHPTGQLTNKLRAWSAIGLGILTLTVTFAAFDWMMSLEPKWYSSIYGALYAMSSLLSGLAMMLCAMPWKKNWTRNKTEIPRDKVFSDLGSLLLAFVILWAYLAFSQYLIIWSGNTLEEITWYQRRLHHGWQWLALGVVVLHFFVPFLLLLSREQKRNPTRLATVACLLVGLGYLNCLWTIKPAFSNTGYVLAGTKIPLPPLTWLDLVIPILMGMVWIALCHRIFTRHPYLPLHDPAWENLREHSHSVPTKKPIAGLEA